LALPEIIGRLSKKTHSASAQVFASWLFFKATFRDVCGTWLFFDSACAGIHAQEPGVFGSVAEVAAFMPAPCPNRPAKN
jgi:hypothetical protein